MKAARSIPLLSALFVTLTLTWGCDFSSDRSNESFENPYLDVAQKHSEGLEYVLNRLEANPVENASRETLLQLAEKYSRAYAEHELGLNRRTSKKMVGLAMKTSAGSEKSKSALSSIPDSLDSRLSSDQTGYIERIMQLAASAPSVESLKGDLRLMERGVSKNLSEESARPVLLASAFALDSRKYWASKGDRWIRTFREISGSGYLAAKSDTTEDKCDLSGKSVSKYDIAGAISGAVGGAMAGPGALTGAVAGAATASLLEATMQGLDCVW